MMTEKIESRYRERESGSKRDVSNKRLQQHTHMQRYGERGAEMKSDVEIEIEIGAGATRGERVWKVGVNERRGYREKVRMNQSQTRGTNRRSDTQTWWIDVWTGAGQMISR